MDWQVLTSSRLADGAAGSLIVLAAGSLAARLCRQPVRRARLIVLSLLGALSVPILGALPFAPRWSVGLPAAPAAILDRADDAAPAEAGSQPHPPGAVGSRVDLGPIEPPGEMTTGHARTGPALAPSGPVASASAARWHFPSARMILLGSYFAVAVGLAAWWFVGQVLLRRVTRSARPVPEAIRAVFLQFAGPGSGRVVLLESDRIASPFTYTWRRGDRKIQSIRRPLPEIFAPTKLTIQEGETPAPLEIRALPSVVIEGRWVDSKGQPGWGISSLVGGKMDGSSWIAQAHVDPQGRFSVKVPHGLEEATLTIMTNEHSSTRYRIGKGVPLVEGNWPRLGTLDHDIKDIEIVRYVAPIIVINATTKDGQQIKDFQADVQYTQAGPNQRKDVYLAGGGNKKDAIQDEQYDGRYRTYNLLPDKEVTVSVSADGFEGASRNFSLPEGKTEEVTFVLEPKAPKGAGR